MWCHTGDKTQPGILLLPEAKNELFDPLLEFLWCGLGFAKKSARSNGCDPHEARLRAEWGSPSWIQVREVNAGYALRRVVSECTSRNHYTQVFSKL